MTNTILDTIEFDYQGDTWETLCVSCYRLRYQQDHFIDIPAVYKGDAGIEGYTSTGIVIQCYCPERKYTDNESHDHYRDKMTADINKLLKVDYATRLFNSKATYDFSCNLY